MRLTLYEDNFHYELENVTRMFFWQVEAVAGGEMDPAGDAAFAAAFPGEDGLRLLVRTRADGRELASEQVLPADAGKEETEHALAVMLWKQLSEHTGKVPAFGIMTGIRPAKYLSSLIDGGMSPAEAEAFLCEHNLVSPEKARLIRMTAENGRKLGKKVRPGGFSLYVSIPFCPSRCSYCSFVSKSVERDRKLTGPYVEALCRELEHTAAITRELGLILQTVYVGGGTPTVLSAEELRLLTEGIAASFGAPLDGEYCVEAGRPDTVTAEKLRVLKGAGVTRISINPQTGNDAVLERIGRRHTAADVERCYELARAEGFGNINADLIAGLPGDDLESFRRSLDWVMGTLDPENVTVHALTLKRASRLREDVSELFSPEASAMVELAQRELVAGGYEPYYMYRQKGTVDSLENTGYAKPGTGCLYNLFIMDELQSIVACGAGAVTKLKDDPTGLIRRISNMKYPAEYLERFGEMLERKDAIREFYGR